MLSNLGRFWYFLLTACTLLPAVVVSAVLVAQLFELNKSNITEQLQERTADRARALEYQLSEITARLEQAALDQNVILATESGVFAASAREVVSSSLQRYDYISLVQLYDFDLWPVESLPIQYELQKPERVIQGLELTKQHLHKTTQYAFIPSVTVAEQNTPIEQANVSLGGSVQIIVPLLKHREGTPQDKDIAGYLSVVISLEKLLNSEALGNERSISIMSGEQNLLPFQPIVTPDDDWMTASAQVRVADAVLELLYAERSERLIAPVYEALSSIVLLIVLLLSAAVSMAYLVSKRLTKPLKSMRKLVDDYTSGDFSSPLPETGFVETSELVDLLGKMASSIENSQKYLEQSIEERTIELEIANVELRRTLAQMEELQAQFVESEKMSSLGQLVAGISHEINTPVGVALTAASSMEAFTFDLRKQLKDQKLTRSFLENFVITADESMRILIKNLNRAVELIGNFKEVAVDQSSEELRQFNVKDYVEEVLITLRPQTRRYDVDFNIQVDDGIIMRSFPGALAQILTNLVVNSITHGFQQGPGNEISIRGTADNGVLTLDYLDNGSGIPENMLSRVFEPFFTTKRGEGGSGLGMHIVYNLSRQKLQGSIGTLPCEKGVYFRLRVPLTLALSSDPATV